MTDERRTEKPKFENLELNKETLQDLTEEETDAAKGGLARTVTVRPTERVTECPISVWVCY
jgi:hypothetical protein